LNLINTIEFNQVLLRNHFYHEPCLMKRVL
jgi:hypothetical protein